MRGLEAGAVDFVTKPFQPEEVVARVHTHLTVQRLQAQLESRNAELARELQVAQELLADARRRVEGALVGSSPAVRALRETIAQRAASVEPLLLTGPAGAGQEAVARAVHHQSPRGRQRVHPRQLRAPRPGPRPGAARRRGATGRRRAAAALGPLELAERGTLYLEEVHQLPPELQVRLAELLEAASRARAGGRHARPRRPRRSRAPRPPTSVESGLRPGCSPRSRPARCACRRSPSGPRTCPSSRGSSWSQHARRAGRGRGAPLGRVGAAAARVPLARQPAGAGERPRARGRSSAREPVLEVDKALLDEGLPLGHYRLLEKLGEGGMGEVWRARHQLLARPCAVKLIRPDRLGGRDRDAAVERFRLEARTIARLSSPNTVRLYDFGAQRVGQPLLRDGAAARPRPLRAREGLRPAARPSASSPCCGRPAARSPRRTRRGSCTATSSPHNLFLCRLGLDCDVVKVLDFGLVKSVGGEDDAQITTEGALTGTPAYMPPERAAGGPGDARSDIYSLGCVAFWMLTGRTVFTGEPDGHDPRPRPHRPRAAVDGLGAARAGARWSSS